MTEKWHHIPYVYENNLVWKVYHYNCSGNILLKEMTFMGNAGRCGVERDAHQVLICTAAGQEPAAPLYSPAQNAGLTTDIEGR